MNNFEFSGFNTGGGFDSLFVLNATKYTKQQAVELCKREYEHRFKDDGFFSKRGIRPLRVPTEADVEEKYCAFRLGFDFDEDYTRGCYTLVNKGDRGAFPVLVIDFENLEK